MQIEIFTNGVMGGWQPKDLDTMLGGNEECLVLLARELGYRGHGVTVYTTLRESREVFDGNVRYLSHDQFNNDLPHDVLISYKTHAPWARGVKANVAIHASCDVELEWPAPLLRRLDKFVALSTYHRDRMPWVPADKMHLAHLALPNEYSAPAPKLERHPLAMLYCTSPDRGLLTLLQDWAKLRQAHGDTAELMVTYNLNRVMGPVGQQLAMALQQPGVQAQLFKSGGMRDVFGRAKYAVLPLNRLDSDLAGFSMRKAESCGAIPVLPFEDLRGTGFQDAVERWIPYRDFLRGDTTARTNAHRVPLPATWRDAVTAYWEPLLGAVKAVAA